MTTELAPGDLAPGEPAAADAARAGGPAAAAGELHLADHLASSVTRQVEISGPSNWQHLASGIDSLDIGLHVQWRDWDQLERALSNGKRSAENTKGILWPFKGVRGCLIFGSGKAPMYAFHLQNALGHLFIARRESPAKQSPNVYASLLSEVLWCGPKKALRELFAFVERLGGVVLASKPSRCDLCADFLIRAGLSLDFLRASAVCQSPSCSPYMKGDQLETIYFGSGGSPIMARLYHKSAEIVKHPEKVWFFPIWKLPAGTSGVWRVEFQVRRLALKEFGIHTISCLQSFAGGLWTYLTTQWLSLRLNDHANVSRRSVHLWWESVASLAQDFGPAMELERERGGGKAPVEWYISHAAGCLPGYAAREGIDDFDSALGLLVAAVREYWDTRDFQQRYEVERVRLGLAEGGAA